MERSRSSPPHRGIPDPSGRAVRVGVVVAIVLLVVAAVVVAQQVRVDRAVETLPPPPALPQPSSQGYEYRVTVEYRRSLQPDGRFSLIDTRRESWTTPDGWVWARQTGTPAADLILEPDAEWRAVRAVEPTAEAVLGALDVPTRFPLPPEERSRSRFVKVAGFLSTERLTASDVPREYREALVAAALRDPGIRRSTELIDPLGRRASVRLVLTYLGYSRSLFLDDDLRALAILSHTAGTPNRGSVTISERQQVERIPEDVLAALGWERAGRVIGR